MNTSKYALEIPRSIDPNVSENFSVSVNEPLALQAYNFQYGTLLY